MQSGQADQVGLLLRGVGRVGDGQNGVAELLDVYRLAEAGLLGIVALQVNAGFVVGDAVGGSRRMVAVLRSALPALEAGCG